MKTILVFEQELFKTSWDNVKNSIHVNKACNKFLEFF